MANSVSLSEGSVVAYSVTGSRVGRGNAWGSRKSVAGPGGLILNGKSNSSNNHQKAKSHTEHQMVCLDLIWS